MNETEKPTPTLLDHLATELKDAEWNVKYHTEKLNTYKAKVSALEALIESQTEPSEEPK